MISRRFPGIIYRNSRQWRRSSTITSNFIPRGLVSFSNSFSTSVTLCFRGLSERNKSSQSRARRNQLSILETAKLSRKRSMSEQAKRFYISNKNESIPMFESRFMEFFTHVHPATPLVLYVPVIVYMLYRAFAQEDMSILAILPLFLAGILMWTLLEA